MSRSSLVGIEGVVIFQNWKATWKQPLMLNEDMDGYLNKNFAPRILGGGASKPYPSERASWKRKYTGDFSHMDSSGRSLNLTSIEALLQRTRLISSEFKMRIFGGNLMFTIPMFTHNLVDTFNVNGSESHTRDHHQYRNNVWAGGGIVAFDSKNGSNTPLLRIKRSRNNSRKGREERMKTSHPHSEIGEPNAVVAWLELMQPRCESFHNASKFLWLWKPRNLLR